MYSIEQFVSQNWGEVITLIFGSGSLAGFVGWLIGKKQQNKTKEAGKETTQLLVTPDTENKN